MIIDKTLKELVEKVTEKIEKGEAPTSYPSIDKLEAVE
jgi:hypothetical protein